MNIDEIAKLVKEIMYLGDSEVVDANKSLFLYYDMTSIDFIDFCFELKKASGTNFTPDDLWPVNKMATQEEFYSLRNKKWTEAGLERLNEIIKPSQLEKIEDNAINLKQLYEYFTLAYVQRRIAYLATKKNSA